MGCGSSAMGSSMSSVDKHPEDLSVKPLKLAKTKIAPFDEWFTEFEKPVNEIIGFHNSVAEQLLDIRIAAGVLLGAFQVTFKAGTDHDAVLLEVYKADGSPPSAAEVDELLKKADVKAADSKLAKEHAKLASAALGLAEAPEGVAGQAEFNEALKAFKAAVGAGYKVVVAVKPAAAHGTASVVAVLSKSSYKVETDEIVEVEVTPLEVARSAKAKDLYGAVKAVAEQTHALAKATKDSTVTEFTVAKTKVQVPEGIEDEAKAASIDKAVATFNTQAFKLVTSATDATVPISIAAAAVAVVKSLRAKAEKLAKDAGKDAASCLPKIEPKFDMKEDGTFDFAFDVAFDPSLRMPSFPACLPAPAKTTWDTIQGVKDNVIEMVGKVKPVIEDVQKLAAESGEKFSNLTDAVKEADLGMGDALTATKNVTQNISAVTGAVAIGPNFLLLIKKLAEELKASADEIKTLV